MKKGSQCKKSKILCTLAAIFVISPAQVTFLFAYFALNALNFMIHISISVSSKGILSSGSTGQKSSSLTAIS